MAVRWAEGLADDSAPRATMRAAQDTADTAKAQLIVTLMQANHCALPNHAVASTTYMMPAMTCRTDRLKSNDATTPESCKMENWQPLSSAVASGGVSN